MKPKVKFKTSKKTAIPRDLDLLTKFPFPCANCNQVIREATLFCSDLCKQEAKFVRYVRSCNRDGRDKQPDVQEAIQIKLAIILGGGYPEEKRRISEVIRSAVIKRDKGRCKICGKPADQIDHISGNSSALKNLQLLCRACHNQKTTASFVPITKESHPEDWDKVNALYRRIEALEPIQLSDSEEWEAIWRNILSARRKTIKE